MSYLWSVFAFFLGIGAAFPLALRWSTKAGVKIVDASPIVYAAHEDLIVVMIADKPYVLRVIKNENFANLKQDAGL